MPLKNPFFCLWLETANFTSGCFYIQEKLQMLFQDRQHIQYVRMLLLLILSLLKKCLRTEEFKFISVKFVLRQILNFLRENNFSSIFLVNYKKSPKVHLSQTKCNYYLLSPPVTELFGLLMAGNACFE